MSRSGILQVPDQAIEPFGHLLFLLLKVAEQYDYIGLAREKEIHGEKVCLSLKCILEKAL
jgi:hypothetical protein